MRSTTQRTSVKPALAFLLILATGIAATLPAAVQAVPLLSPGAEPSEAGAPLASGNNSTAAYTVTFDPAEAESDRGAAAATTLRVKNTGEEAVSLLVVRTGLTAGWTSSFLATNLTLEPQESAEVAVTLTPPSGSEDGARGALTVTASASGTRGVSATFSVTVSDPHHAVGVNVTPRNQTAAPGANVTYRVIVRNAGTFTETVALAATEATGEVALHLNATTVTLAPGASTTVALQATAPTNGTAADGTYRLVVTARASTEEGSLEAEADAFLQVRAGGPGCLLGISLLCGGPLALAPAF